MALTHIQHFLVAADDIDATRDWYARVLQMRAGPHPDFGFPVHWMYAGDVDLIHIAQNARAANDIQKVYLDRTSGDTGGGTGAIDHIAFNATELRKTLEHLRAEGVEYKHRRASGQDLFQVFFYDPNGIKLELNFAAAEAEGIQADLLATELMHAAPR